MSNNILKEYYEKDADRFWDPTLGMVGRDLDVYPLLADLKGQILEYGCGAGSLILNLALEERKRFRNLETIGKRNNCITTSWNFYYQ